MRVKNVQILSTKLLEQVSKEDLSAIADVVDYDILNLVSVNPMKNEFHKNIIFTSYKATLRGLELLGANAKDYHYFCVGKKSEKYLKDQGLDVYGFAFYSKDLAELLVENLKNSSFSYLCSKDRLSNLPDILSENNVDFEEVYTYESEVCDTCPDGDFDIYLWFSPKGIRSFGCGIKKEALHICIGETTANAAKEKYPEDHVYYPETPNMEELMKLTREKAFEINSLKCAEAVTKQ